MEFHFVAVELTHQIFGTSRLIDEKVTRSSEWEEHWHIDWIGWIDHYTSSL